MFWATLASFFDGLSTILWKKAMAYNKLGWGVFVWFAFSAPFLALLFCLPFGFVRGPHEIALVAFALLALS